MTPVNSTVFQGYVAQRNDPWLAMTDRGTSGVSHTLAWSATAEAVYREFSLRNSNL